MGALTLAAKLLLQNNLVAIFGCHHTTAVPSNATLHSPISIHQCDDVFSVLVLIIRPYLDTSCSVAHPWIIKTPLSLTFLSRNRFSISSRSSCSWQSKSFVARTLPPHCSVWHETRLCSAPTPAWWARRPAANPSSCCCPGKVSKFRS